jgi:hypothetical protein
MPCPLPAWCFYIERHREPLSRPLAGSPLLVLVDLVPSIGRHEPAGPRAQERNLALRVGRDRLCMASCSSHHPRRWSAKTQDPQHPTSKCDGVVFMPLGSLSSHHACSTLFSGPIELLSWTFISFLSVISPWVYLSAFLPYYLLCPFPLCPNPFSLWELFPLVFPFSPCLVFEESQPSRSCHSARRRSRRAWPVSS